MYIPKHNRLEDESEIYALMKRFSFATLITPQPLTATHLPLLLEDGGKIRGHLARANTQWERLEGSEVLAIFQAGHAYISPSNYLSRDVPTWNYTAVHAYCTAKLIHDKSANVNHLERMVNLFESGREVPYTVDMNEDFYRRMVNGVVCFELEIVRLEAKAKLSQNKPLGTRQNVRAELEHSEDLLERDVGERMGRLECESQDDRQQKKPLPQI